MKSFITFSTSTALLLAAFFITGCSSGGGGAAAPVTSYTGSTTPAAIDDTNAQAIGTTAGESIQPAASTSNTPYGISIDSSIDMKQLNKLVLAVARQASNLPAGLDFSNEFCSSGTATSNDPSSTSGPVTLNVTFSNCVILDGNGETLNGIVNIRIDDISDSNSGFTATYSNFTVTDPVNGTTTINATIVCDGSFSCTYSSDFVGSDGAIHRVSDFNISGSSTSGYSGSATFYHNSYGEVSIIVSGVTYGGSCGSIPNGGSISFTSSTGSSGTINFSSTCTVSGTWSNGSGSGSF